MTLKAFSLLYNSYGGPLYVAPVFLSCLYLMGQGLHPDVYLFLFHMLDCSIPTRLHVVLSAYSLQSSCKVMSVVQLIITILSEFISKGKQLEKNQKYKDGNKEAVLAVHKGRDKNIKKITDAVVSITNFAEIELSILKSRSAESDQIIVKLNAVKDIRKNISQMGEKYNNPIRMTLVQLHDGGLPQMERIVDLLKKAITQTEQQAQPKNPEARRMLRFFMATLFNPQLEAPSPLKYVMSLTTLVPHYAEDVIYALDADAVKAAVNVRPKAGEMTDLVAPTGYSITCVSIEFGATSVQ